MLYLVSGHMRTGTSAMMKALMAGGLEGHYDPDRMKYLNPRTRTESYRLNEEVYEPSMREMSRWDFPLAHDGKLIKVLWGGVSKLAVMPGGIRCVFMMRDPEEIRQSYEGAFAKQKATAPAWLATGGYEERMDATLAHLDNRDDVKSVTVLRFREDLIDNPLGSFERLAADGWPLNPQAAAEVIDPTLCRYRREALEVGI